ncbi:hypothetical protein HNP48_001685 [Acidovorax soli]|uniref:Uncharacterized protein n=1 Tax=Acidovorax soli TaxID=592050 RepID=A0A7X0U8D3_9BURK|nr:hypothetical protein [Acidovorax soli]MBB6559021.1 hypothetical protein [Acidovorax soli]
MNRQELHALLQDTAGLVPEPVDNPIACSYFFQRVEWHPQRSTRVFRVLVDSAGEPARIQLCASSDNNNTVLLAQPFSREQLLGLVRQEVALITARLDLQAPAAPWHAATTAATPTA